MNKFSWVIDVVNGFVTILLSLLMHQYHYFTIENSPPFTITMNERKKNENQFDLGEFSMEKQSKFEMFDYRQWHNWNQLKFRYYSMFQIPVLQSCPLYKTNAVFNCIYISMFQSISPLKSEFNRIETIHPTAKRQ